MPANTGLHSPQGGSLPMNDLRCRSATQRFSGANAQQTAPKENARTVEHVVVVALVTVTTTDGTTGNTEGTNRSERFRRNPPEVR